MPSHGRRIWRRFPGYKRQFWNRSADSSLTTCHLDCALCLCTDIAVKYIKRAASYDHNVLALCSTYGIKLEVSGHKDKRNISGTAIDRAVLELYNSAKEALKNLAEATQQELAVAAGAVAAAKGSGDADALAAAQRAMADAEAKALKYSHQPFDEPFDGAQKCATPEFVTSTIDPLLQVLKGAMAGPGPIKGVKKAMTAMGRYVLVLSSFSL